MKYMKKMLAALAVCFCLSLTAVPAMEVFGSSVQTETAAVQETQTEGQAAAEASGDASEDEAVFMIIMMGGGLLVILVAVIAAVSTVSSAVSVAANMDVDGE